MAEISHAEIDVATPKACCNLQAPSLVLRGVRLLSRDRNTWGGKTWNRRLNLCECLASSERANKRPIRSGSLLIQACCLIGRKVSSYHCERVQSGGLLEKLNAMPSGTDQKRCPIPPRNTVLCDTPKGCQAKLNRGAHKMLSLLANASFWLIRTA